MNSARVRKLFLTDPFRLSKKPNPLSNSIVDLLHNPFHKVSNFGKIVYNKTVYKGHSAERAIRSDSKNNLERDLWRASGAKALIFIGVFRHG